MDRSKKIFGVAGLGLVLAFGLACGSSKGATGGGNPPSNSSRTVHGRSHLIPPEARYNSATGDYEVNTDKYNITYSRNRDGTVRVDAVNPSTGKGYHYDMP